MNDLITRFCDLYYIYNYLFNKIRKFSPSLIFINGYLNGGTALAVTFTAKVTSNLLETHF
jgi:hypothetical protein